MKKMLALLMVVFVVVMGVGAVASAATVDDIMTALEATAIPEVYLTQAQSYLNANPVTAAQADAVIQYINAADATAGSVTGFNQLTSAQASAIYKDITAAAAALNLTASYDSTTLVIKDATGKSVLSVSDSQVVKQTGHDYSIVLVGFGIMVLAGGVALLSRKLRNTGVQAAA